MIVSILRTMRPSQSLTAIVPVTRNIKSNVQILAKENGLVPFQGCQITEFHCDNRPPDHVVSCTQQFRQSSIDVRGPEVVYFWDKLKQCFGSKKSDKKKGGKKAKKQSCKKKKCGKQKDSCLKKKDSCDKPTEKKELCKTGGNKDEKKDVCKQKEEKKDDPCKKKDEKKDDPCKKKDDPCKKKEEKKEDPCKKKEVKKEDPCKKKEDPCKKKEEKKEDPCKKKEVKKEDPCKKKEEKKEDPCKKKEEKKEDPCKKKEVKKEDPCKKKEEKKEDPCKKKEDPCKKKEEKKEDPCKKKEDPCKKKEDPCKKKEEKKEDPCKKKEEKKEDPCKKKEEKKEDPCKKKEEKKEDPCKKKEAKKEDPCKKKEDPCKKKEEKKEDPCKNKEDPCKKKEEKKEDPCKKKEEKKEDPCKKKEDPCAPCNKKEDACKKKDPCAKFLPDAIPFQDPFVFFTRSKTIGKKEEERCSRPCRDPCAEGACDVLPGQDEPCSASASWKIKVRPCRKSPGQSARGGNSPSGPCIIDKVEIVEQKLEPEDNCGLTKHPCGKKVCPNKCDVKRGTKFSNLQEDPQVAVGNLLDVLSYQTRLFQSTHFLNFANARGPGPVPPSMGQNPKKPAVGHGVPGTAPPVAPNYSEKVAGLLEKLKALWQGPESNQQIKSDKTRPQPKATGKHLFGMLDSEAATTGDGFAHSVSAAVSLESLSAEGDSHILLMTDDFEKCEDKVPPCPLEPPTLPCPAPIEDCIKTTDDLWSDIDANWGYERFPWKSDIIKEERLDEVSQRIDDPYANNHL